MTRALLGTKRVEGVARVLKVLNNAAVLNTETMNVFDVNEATCRAVESIENGRSREEVCSTMGCTREELDEILTTLSQPGVQMTAEQQATFDRKRLVLMVSHDCNLRCRYCYASHGTYGTGLPSMTPESALEIVRACDKNLGKPDFYMFFGGEPTLNMPAITDVFNELSKDGAKQTFGAVTNGTFSRELMQPLLQSGKMSLTFSLDGAEEVHDQLRPSVRKKGSFTTALGNLLWSKEFIAPAVECTFTPDHVKKGHSLVKLIHFFSAVGVSAPHIVPVSPQREYRGFDSAALVAEYRKAIDYCLDSFVEGNPRWFTILGGIMAAFTAGRKREYLCPAGTTTTCVDSNGDLYPCFMFSGNEEVRLGNIFSFDRTSYEANLSAFVEGARKSNREGCDRCWAVNICSGCMGNSYWATGRLTGNDPSWCNLVRETIAYVAEKIARLHSNKVVWERLVEAFKNPVNDAE